MKAILLHNAVIVTSAKEAKGSVIIAGEKIAGVIYADGYRRVRRKADLRQPSCLYYPNPLPRGY